MLCVKMTSCQLLSKAMTASGTNHFMTGTASGFTTTPAGWGGAIKAFDTNAISTHDLHTLHEGALCIALLGQAACVRNKGDSESFHPHEGSPDPYPARWKPSAAARGRARAARDGT